MNNQSEENVKLDYNLLLLKHLDRLGFTSSSLLGEVISVSGQVIQPRIKDKADALNIGIWFLQSLIPSELCDEEYDKELIMADKERDKVEEKLRQHVIVKIRHDMARLKACVNLLARKGYLFDTAGVMTIKRSPVNPTVFNDE